MKKFNIALLTVIIVALFVGVSVASSATENVSSSLIIGGHYATYWGTVYNASNDMPISGAIVVVYQLRSLSPVFSGTTMGNGSFKFTYYTTYDYKFEISASGYESINTNYAVIIQNPGKWYLTPLQQIQVKYAASGFVYSGSTGAYIQGATVAVYYLANGTFVKSQVTPASGYFEFYLPPNTYNFTASATGYKSNYQHITLNANDSSIDFILTKITAPATQYKVSGQVYDYYNSSKTINGAYIEFEGNTSNIFTTSSGTNGFYSISVPSSAAYPNGQYTIIVTASGYQQYTGSLSVTSNMSYNIAMMPVTTVVHYYYLNISVQNANTYAIIPNALEQVYQNSSLLYKQYTNLNGKASFDIPSGSYTLVSSASGFYSSNEAISLTTNEYVNVLLTPLPISSYTVSGTISNSTGVMKGISITVTLGTNTISTTNGSFVFNNIVNGTYALTVSAAHYNTVSENVIVNGANVQLSITMTKITAVSSTYTVSGTISNSTGVMSGVNVTVSFDSKQVITNNGSFSFSGIPNGTYELIASSPGYYSAYLNITVNGANVQLQVRLSILPSPSTYTISGVVYLGSVPGAGVNVVLYNPSTRIGENVTTESTGTFSFSSVSDGTYVLTANYKGYNTYSQTVVVNNANVQLYITLEQSTATNSFSVFGQLINSNGLMTNVAVTISFATQTITTTNGLFTFNNIVNGTYELIAKASGYNTTYMNVTVAGANLQVQVFMQRYVQSTNGIYGYVTYANGPLSGVNVQAFQNGKVVSGTLTNATGYYSIVLSPGNYTIEFSKSGYNTINVTISLKNSLQINEYMSSIVNITTSTGNKTGGGSIWITTGSVGSIITNAYLWIGILIVVLLIILLVPKKKRSRR